MTKALAILNSMRELELKNELSTSGTDAAIAELEEAMKPKTCDGCVYLDGVICRHDRGLYCVRQFEADYFVKDNA